MLAAEDSAMAKVCVKQMRERGGQQGDEYMKKKMQSERAQDETLLRPSLHEEEVVLPATMEVEMAVSR